MSRTVTVLALVAVTAAGGVSVASARSDDHHAVAQFADRGSRSGVSRAVLEPTVRSHRPVAAGVARLPRWVLRHPLLPTFRHSGIDLRRVTFFADGAALVRSAGRQAACPDNTVCVYQHRDFGGARFYFGGCCTTFNLAAYGWNDTISSWRNRKGPGYPACMYRDANLGGWRICLQPRSGSTYVGNFYNDRASSIRIGV
jgi:hypothetical protein